MIWQNHKNVLLHLKIAWPNHQKFLFISLLQCFKIVVVHISHVLLQGQASHLIFLTNTTPSKNWSEGRDLHQCSLQRIVSKNYIEEKMSMNRKHLLKIYFRQKLIFHQKIRLEWKFEPCFLCTPKSTAGCKMQRQNLYLSYLKVI